MLDLLQVFRQSVKIQKLCFPDLTSPAARFSAEESVNPLGIEPAGGYPPKYGAVLAWNRLRPKDPAAGMLKT